jgi:hypothetical protein
MTNMAAGRGPRGLAWRVRWVLGAAGRLASRQRVAATQARLGSVGRGMGCAGVAGARLRAVRAGLRQESGELRVLCAAQRDRA